MVKLEIGDNREEINNVRSRSNLREIFCLTSQIKSLLTAMDTVSLVLSIVICFSFIVNILMAMGYALPIIFLPRFYHRNNFLTLNVCIANILCFLVWLPDDPLFMSDGSRVWQNKFYISLKIFQTLLTVQLPLSFALISVHRYCSIVYRKKGFFKTKRWIVLSITLQWTFGILLSIPDLTNFRSVRLSLMKRNIFEEEFFIIIAA